MMEYQVLSRRYRPRLFGEVIGQQAIVRILSNAITSGKIPHAFLFTGIRGTGKTTTARIFARSLNCARGVTVDPCNECESCRQLIEGRSMDVMEIDGASNTSVNDVRMIKDNTRFLPSQNRYKVYIIDEVHMLSTEAFNALLKTLEEPPSYVVFILATTEPRKIPETVLSRCVRLNFRRVEPGEIVRYLSSVLAEEGVSFDESALFLISRQSEGSVRDALSLLELVLAYGGGRVTERDVVDVLGVLSRERIFEAISLIAAKDAPGLLRLIGVIRDEGGDLAGFLESLVFYIRHLVLRTLGLDFDSREFSSGERQSLDGLAGGFSPAELAVYYQGLRQLAEQLRYSGNPQFDIEIGLIKLLLLKEFLEGSPIAPGERPSVPATAVRRDVTSAAERPAETAASAGSEPSAPAPSADSDVPADVRNAAGFTGFLRKKKPLLASQLQCARIDVRDDIVHIVFGDEHQLFYEHLNHDDGEKAALKELSEEYFGAIRGVRIEIDRSAPGRNGGADGGLRETVMSNPRLGMILGGFEGAKIIDMRKTGRNISPDSDGETDLKEESDE